MDQSIAFEQSSLRSDNEAVQGFPIRVGEIEQLFSIYFADRSEIELLQIHLASRQSESWTGIFVEVVHSKLQQSRRVVYQER